MVKLNPRTQGPERIAPWLAAVSFIVATMLWCRGLVSLGLLFQGLTATAGNIKRMFSPEVPSKNGALYRWAIVFCLWSGVLFGLSAVLKAEATRSGGAEETAGGATG